MEGKLPFLDVCVDLNNGKRSTRVYRKKTDGGACLNGLSECPTRYKRGVVRIYVRRALKICSSWELFEQEMIHVKQMLVNNSYTMTDIDQEIRRAINDYMKSDEKTEKEDKNTHVLYYKNQMSSAYKLDERILKDIIKKYVTPTGSNHLKLLVYYKNRRTANMVMQNNQCKEPPLKCTNVVYEFTCPHEDCKPRKQKVSYIGHTTNTLTKRLTFHKQSGEIQKHMKQEHHRDITRSDLVDNTVILAQEPNRRRLKVLEAVYIQMRRPSMNIQRDHAGIITLHDISA